MRVLSHDDVFYRYIVPGSETNEEAKIIEYRQLPLAKLVPVVSKLSHQILGSAGDSPNVFLEVSE